MGTRIFSLFQAQEQDEKTYFSISLRAQNVLSLLLYKKLIDNFFGFLLIDNLFVLSDFRHLPGSYWIEFDQCQFLDYCAPTPPLI